MCLVFKPNIEQAQHRGKDVEAVLYDKRVQFHVQLEFQRDAAHGSKSSHWDEAYLVIAVVVAVA